MSEDIKSGTGVFRNGDISVDGGKLASFQQKCYEWQPQEDITAYELSLCMVPLMGFIAGHDVLDMVEALPESALRHFKVVG